MAKEDEDDEDEEEDAALAYSYVVGGRVDDQSVPPLLMSESVSESESYT